MNFQTLQPLGWSNFFFQQLSIDEVENNNLTSFIFRVTIIHRNQLIVQGGHGEHTLLIPDGFQPISQNLAVGDWVIAQPRYEHFELVRILDNKNKIQRVSNDVTQLIAANIDYLWIITSANEEFNINRLQRYLSMAYEFEITPVVIITKMDLCADIGVYEQQLQSLKITHTHFVTNQNIATYNALDQYFLEGNSIALVGSSGVGKSTLINAITGADQSVNLIREDDAKGKHTTTYRSLFFCKNNVAIIDTPGMREVQLLDSQAGIGNTFEDILTLAKKCKFNNCSHTSEPSCAILSAINLGEVSKSHYNNYQKLLREDAFYKRKTQGKFAEKKYHKTFSKKIKRMMEPKH